MTPVKAPGLAPWHLDGMPVATLPLPADRAASVFLPKEHGSWSLALEPLALGLLVTPSWAGGALAVAALAGFFARRPLKTALTAPVSSRRTTARLNLLLWSALAAAGLGLAAFLGAPAALWPLLPAAALGALFVTFDLQNDSRAAAAELAGCACFAFLPAALATLAGAPPATALALAGLAAARSLPTVMTVRTALRLAKGEKLNRLPSLFAASLAATALGALTANGLAPWTAAALGLLLLARTLWLLGPARPLWPARRLGMTEGLLGLGYVLVLAATWPASP